MQRKIFHVKVTNPSVGTKLLMKNLADECKCRLEITTEKNGDSYRSAYIISSKNRNMIKFLEFLIRNWIDTTDKLESILRS